jgi:hypothetical protein
VSAKKIALTLSKQDRLPAPKKAAPRNFAAFFTVSFQKKKSNKIPAVLDAKRRQLLQRK